MNSILVMSFAALAFFVVGCAVGGVLGWLDRRAVTVAVRKAAITRRDHAA